MSVLFEYMIDFCDEQMSGWEKNLPTKTCLYCKEALPKSAFPKHIHHKDNLDSRCYSCKKNEDDIREKLRSVAPSKPTICECCGEEGKMINLDHDHDTLEIRGWICSACNTGIGKLSDSIEGVKKALTYLQKDKKAYNTRNVWMIRHN